MYFRYMVIIKLSIFLGTDTSIHVRYTNIQTDTSLPKITTRMTDWQAGRHDKIDAHVLYKP